MRDKMFNYLIKPGEVLIFRTAADLSVPEDLSLLRFDSRGC